MIQTLKYFLTLVLVCTLVGCGGGGGSEVAAGGSGTNNDPIGSATIQVRQSIQAQAVPASIDTVRVTGFRFAINGGVLNPIGGGVTLASREFPLSPLYTIEDVPTNTTAIRIEYLDGGQVVGLYVQEITLTPGQVLEIVDPAFVSVPEGVEEFELFLVGAYTTLAPPGEKIVVVGGFAADFPVLFFAVPESPDLESIVFADSLPNTQVDGRDVTDEIRAFTSFSSSNPSVVDVANSGLFNSTFKSGTLNVKQAGDATITASFLGLTASLDVRAVIVESPFVRPDALLRSYDPPTVERIPTTAEVVYPRRIETNVDVSTELIFRPSDKPEVARWDTTPGREGYIIRGSQPGRVVLWAQHPNNYIWLPVPVLNQGSAS